MNTFTTKHSILALMLLIFTQGVHAQTKEAYNWYFGASVGMTWNETQTIEQDGKTLSNLPTSLPPSAMVSQHEGVFCMSDANGNLLFYSDGMTIWNKNHQVMDNGDGLTGHDSSAQSGIVIPYPGQSNLYIAATLSVSFDDIFAYSIIDMSANGGLGAVITKNELFTGANGILSESVSAVRHSNGIDYWIVAVGKGSGVNSALNVWKVTTSGVQADCYTSQPLPEDTFYSGDDAHGYLRFSLDGKYFAWPTSNMYRFEGDGFRDLFYGTFDPSDGTFPIIKAVDLEYVGYGAEFSPSCKILYLTDITTRSIKAYKFEELLSSIVAPRTVATPTNPYPLQLAPDGRIYSTVNQTTSMFVIDNVNDFDNFTTHVIDGLLPVGTYHWEIVWEDELYSEDFEYQGRIGLPNFPSNLFAPIEGVIGSNQTICSGSAPAQLTSVADAKCTNGVISEPITYLWEHSTDNENWSTVTTGTNNLSTYQPPMLTDTTYYRRRATSVGCSTVYSNVVTITVVDPIIPGTIEDNQNIASGATPDEIESTNPASGGVGTITYQWQSSPDGTSWTDIPGADGAGYSPGALTTTTYYRRAATCDCGTVYSNRAVITVTEYIGSGDDYITAADAEICSGDPVTLTASLTVPGSITDPVFYWFASPTSLHSLHSGPTYTPSPNLTMTTTFYVLAAAGDDPYRYTTRKAVTVTVTPRIAPEMIKITQ